MKFWDASAIIPLCLEGPHTERMREIVEENPSMVAWWGTPVECYSSFARLRREEVLERSGEDQAREFVHRLADAWTEVQPSDVVREHAARALLLHPLRAADSVQLAAALVWTEGRPAGQGFVCLDRRLAQAADREGFEVLPTSLLE